MKNMDALGKGSKRALLKAVHIARGQAAMRCIFLRLANTILRKLIKTKLVF